MTKCRVIHKGTVVYCSVTMCGISKFSSAATIYPSWADVTCKNCLRSMPRRRKGDRQLSERRR